MIHYTVTYVDDAQDELARLWLDASDRSAVTDADNQIDRILRVDASHKGISAGSTLRQLIVAPLVVEFTVEEDDRKVTIWSVRHVGELTNGR